ncbi:helix-turn-helix domain-containing protein [Phenylobacterium sp.]|uniref:TetR/AcrR family transcriptional regulator n=1 Tax=Phenylobacterium sp. TaxID=1871053 RepID=UPI00286A8C2C|nr:helix-turn-helix domain-containing protein [Phenylobacterium sp.]
MADAGGKRVRRTVEASRQAILEAAERCLIDEGPNGVKVQRIARDLGLTDAAIHYHFGNREGLMEALLRFSGRRFVEEVQGAMSVGDAAGIDLRQAASRLSELYERRGTARLAMWLMLAGWSPKGAGMLQPLAEWLHAGRAQRARAAGLAAPAFEDSQKMIALLGAVTFAQALSGDAHLRSAGLQGVAQNEFMAWVADQLET